MLLRHRIRKYPESDSLPYSSDSCGRKPYPERKVGDSKISEYVGTRSKTTPSQK